jgi:hypothetical protein
MKAGKGAERASQHAAEFPGAAHDHFEKGHHETPSEHRWLRECFQHQGQKDQETARRSKAWQQVLKDESFRFQATEGRGDSDRQ